MNREKGNVIFLWRLADKGGQLLLNVLYHSTRGRKGSVDQLV